MCSRSLPDACFSTSRNQWVPGVTWAQVSSLFFCGVGGVCVPGDTQHEVVHESSDIGGSEGCAKW